MITFVCTIALCGTLCFNFKIEISICDGNKKNLMGSARHNLQTLLIKIFTFNLLTARLYCTLRKLSLILISNIHHMHKSRV